MRSPLRLLGGLVLELPRAPVRRGLSTFGAGGRRLPGRARRLRLSQRSAGQRAAGPPPEGHGLITGNPVMRTGGDRLSPAVWRRSVQWVHPSPLPRQLPFPGCDRRGRGGAGTHQHQGQQRRAPLARGVRRRSELAQVGGGESPARLSRPMRGVDELETGLIRLALARMAVGRDDLRLCILTTTRKASTFSAASERGSSTWRRLATRARPRSCGRSRA
jgi:hypothetical protein